MIVEVGGTVFYVLMGRWDTQDRDRRQFSEEIEGVAGKRCCREGHDSSDLEGVEAPLESLWFAGQQRWQRLNPRMSECQ